MQEQSIDTERGVYVVIPTYNERENIERMITAVTKLYPTIGIVVVDDNSPDGTGALVSLMAAKNPNIRLHSRPKKLGLASAYLESFGAILENDPRASVIITMDSDFSHNPSVIDVFLEEIKRHEMVIGSRYVRGGRLENWPIGRIILSRVGNIYATTASGTGIRDLTAGFQAFRAPLLRHEAFKDVSATGFAFQMEMKLIAHYLGARILEVPITFKNRENGYSKISSGLHRYIYEVLIMPWRLRQRYSSLKR